MRLENCLRCGLPEDNQKHNSRNPPPEGWHSFHGQAYLDALEDALLFIRERNQKHEWLSTGIIIDTVDSFSEKSCKVCGAINWGGKEDGICFGNSHAELAVIVAHNRRAFELSRTPASV